MLLRQQLYNALKAVVETDDHILMFTARGVATAQAANTIEVFIDDKPVQVDPACTVLQVVSLSLTCLRWCRICGTEMVQVTLLRRILASCS